MALTHQIWRRVRPVIPQALTVCVLAYFAYHIVEGERGITAWKQLTGELVEARRERSEVAARRATLEHRVELLRPDGLDPDLLEEQARSLLNMGRPTDRVILHSTIEPTAAGNN